MNSGTNSSIPIWMAALCATAALSCGKAETAPLASAEPAGRVEAVEGLVSAMRAAEGSATRPLAVAASVWADDTITTAAGASVAIRLAHNAALWRLEGGIAKRVDQSAAWKAPKDAAPQAIAQRTDPVQTASAGRHSAHEAAGTAESAARAEPPTAAPPPAPPALDAPPVAAAAPAAAPPPPEPQSTAKPAAPRPLRHVVRQATGGAPRPGGGLRGSSADDGNFGFDGMGGDGAAPSAKTAGGSASAGSVADAPGRLPTIAIAVQIDDATLKVTLQRLLGKRKAALARCAQQATQAGAALPPKFTVRIEIGGAGAVTVLAIDGAADPLKACARAVVASLRGLPDSNPAVEAEIVVGVR